MGPTSLEGRRWAQGPGDYAPVDLGTPALVEPGTGRTLHPGPFAALTRRGLGGGPCTLRRVLPREGGPRLSPHMCGEGTRREPCPGRAVGRCPEAAAEVDGTLAFLGAEGRARPIAQRSWLSIQDLICKIRGSYMLVPWIRGLLQKLGFSIKEA